VPFDKRNGELIHWSRVND